MCAFGARTLCRLFSQIQPASQDSWLAAGGRCLARVLVAYRTSVYFFATNHVCITHRRPNAIRVARMRLCINSVLYVYAYYQYILLMYGIYVYWPSVTCEHLFSRAQMATSHTLCPFFYIIMIFLPVATTAKEVQTSFCVLLKIRTEPVCIPIQSEQVLVDVSLFNRILRSR